MDTNELYKDTLTGNFGSHSVTAVTLTHDYGALGIQSAGTTEADACNLPFILWTDSVLIEV